jgi:flagellar hook-associated protein 3 FlgL
MRISTAQVYQSQNDAISQNYAQMNLWNRRIATGKKLEKLSDDAPSGVMLLKRTQLKAQVEQYQQNLQTAKSNFGSSENILGEITTLLQRANTLTIQGANASIDQSGREAISAEVKSMQTRMLDLFNSKNASGAHLFAGHKSDSQPYTLGPSGLVYNGDAGSLLVETSPNSTLKVNTTGGTDFLKAYKVLDDLQANLVSGHLGNISGISLKDVQSTLTRFTQLRSEAGTGMQEVQRLNDLNLRRMDELTEGISDIEDVDLTEAFTQLKQAETAYQASLTVASSAFRLSLLDYLR